VGPPSPYSHCELMHCRLRRRLTAHPANCVARSSFLPVADRVFFAVVPRAADSRGPHRHCLRSLHGAIGTVAFPGDSHAPAAPKTFGSPRGMDLPVHYVRLRGCGDSRPFRTTSRRPERRPQPGEGRHRQKPHLPRAANSMAGRNCYLPTASEASTIPTSLPTTPPKASGSRPGTTRPTSAPTMSFSMATARTRPRPASYPSSSMHGCLRTAAPS